jgi:hypothetical protein
MDCGCFPMPGELSMTQEPFAIPSRSILLHRGSYTAQGHALPKFDTCGNARSTRCHWLLVVEINDMGLTRGDE